MEQVSPGSAEIVSNMVEKLEDKVKHLKVVASLIANLPLDMKDERASKTTEAEALEKIISSILDLKEPEISSIIRMEQLFPGTAKSALEYAKDMRDPLTFDCFVEATHNEVLKDLSGFVDYAAIEDLYHVRVEHDGSEWREVGYHEFTPLSRETQDLFAIYVRTGDIFVREKLINAINKEMKEMDTGI